MSKKDNIFVFWWSSVKFEGKPKENFGDILSKYLVEKISNKRVIWKQPKKMTWNFFGKKVYFTTGSILSHANKNTVVWGSGIISKKDEVDHAEFLAVRGPETYNYLKSKNYKVSEVFGDPAVLLPKYYNPKHEKTHDLGIIPHYVDFKKVNNWYANNDSIKVIDLLNNNIEDVVDDILSCNKIISSSLHGLIVSHAYYIPAVLVKFSDKLYGDGVKFIDYFKSVKLKPYDSVFIDEKPKNTFLETLFTNYEVLPKKNVMEHLGKSLLEVCPFKT